MKKIFIALIMISVLTSFSACKNVKTSNEIQGNDTNIEETNKNEQNIDKDSLKDTDKDDSNDVSNQDDKKSQLLKSAYEGKIDSVEFGIGDIGTDIIKKLGEPDQKDYILGGLYFQYGEITFLTNGFDESGEVVSILFTDETTEVFGIKLGMTVKEIEEVLGVPDKTLSLKDNEENELYEGNWATVYDLGKYKLTFIHEGQDTPTKWFELSLKK